MLEQILFFLLELPFQIQARLNTSLLYQPQAALMPIGFSNDL
jgi:hypothetical protein